MLRTKKKPAHGFKIHPGKDNDFDYDVEFYIDPPPLRVISFKGGGSRVIVYTKFLELMHEQGRLETVEEVGGSSSGCIASAFAAIHYENPHDRTNSLDDVSRVDKTDLYSKSPGWKVYKTLTFPLLVVSKPFEWSANGINWLAVQCNKIPPGLIIGIPLKIIAFFLRVVAFITSPRTYVAASNLITGGGVYRGDKFEERVRLLIRRDTQNGIEDILSKLDSVDRERIITHLVKIGLCTQKKYHLVVCADVTFRHLHELSKLPGSQFKDYYTTGLRKRDKTLVVFNVENTPDMAIHHAMRLAVTFPLYFQARKYNGDKYLDGGIIDNSPVNQSNTKSYSAFKQEHGITDKLARLNVRVEYPHELESHLWKKPPATGRVGKFLDNIKRKIAKKIAGDVDVFATDEAVTQNIQKDFAQRTLQLPDFGIGQLEKTTSDSKRNQVNNELPKIVRRYFKRHDGEKVVIQNYQGLQNIPPVKRVRLLKYLQNDAIKNEEIFNIPGKTAAELVALRDEIINAIKHLPLDGENTASISCALNIAADADHELDNPCAVALTLDDVDARMPQITKIEGSETCSVPQQKHCSPPTLRK